MSFGQRRMGFGGNRRFDSVRKPVEVGKEYNVTISDTSRRGDGIAKVDGFVIFVPGTSMGQQVRVKVTAVSERYASGQVVTSETAASTGTASGPAESTEKSTA